MAFSDFYKENSQRPLNQIDKATAILLTMSKETSVQLLKHFSKDELQAIINSAQSLPEIPPDELMHIVNEFENLFIEGIGLTENAKTIESILKEGLSKNEVDNLLRQQESVETSEVSVWYRLKTVNPVLIGKFLLNEHPQTAAYILSMLPSDLGAKVFLQFPDTKHADIMKRTVNLREVSPYAVKIIENRISKILLEVEANSGTSGSEKIANIINELEKSQVDTLLKSLETLSKEAFDKVRPKVFLFEDLITIPSPSLSTLLNNIPIETLITALYSTSTELREYILNSTSIRQRRIIESEISINTQYVNPQAISIAQRIILQEAIRLEKEGKFEMKKQ
ncbi:Flagellar motor switch protein FliG [Liberibacter crescens BT-1]|uniref:Flagellar motor switch protein FliG n=1 Tax=Liberibacter crescens (strain BT-1) TaxID=1215343 RepID=L0ETL8_LIBCB|nr:flagellar motor switch protein FliG [Liberibacter crescens]AGA64175.1 Flagellar motor switch protein FliG [Liberibacter crescens BT-1]AMC12438.1 flagellar motor switch protein FliG [Liberibacter crescens]